LGLALPCGDGARIVRREFGDHGCTRGRSATRALLQLRRLRGSGRRTLAGYLAARRVTSDRDRGSGSPRAGPPSAR
jgi:hypothetical protein